MNNLDELVKIYLTIREARAKLEEQDKQLKEEMEVISTAMLAICNEANADSIKTQEGTVIRQTKDRFYCSDWDSLKQFILENNAVDLLERRIHQTNFKEFMSEHQADGLPPGVNCMREFAISVRKPTNS